MFKKRISTYRYTWLCLGVDNIMLSMSHVLLELFGSKNIITIGLIINQRALDQSRLLCVVPSQKSARKTELDLARILDNL